jgi:hypothetical protein
MAHAYKETRISLASDSPRARIGFSPFLIQSPRALSQASEEVPMESSDRRRDTRVNIRMPVRFRTLNAAGSDEQVAVSENISQHGLFFTTDFPLKIGMRVEVSLQMPRTLAERVPSDVKCVAHVVHVGPSPTPGGLAGIGLQIDRFEIRVQEPERWAS